MDMDSVIHIFGIFLLSIPYFIFSKLNSMTNFRGKFYTLETLQCFIHSFQADYK